MASQVPMPVTVEQSIDNDDDRLDLAVRDGYLIINSSKPITIKIFSILGQLVTQRSIPAGVTRIKLPGRGIYIFKAADITRRITV